MRSLLRVLLCSLEKSVLIQHQQLVKGMRGGRRCERGRREGRRREGRRGERQA